jgi:hypothetical protein
MNIIGVGVPSAFSSKTYNSKVKVVKDRIILPYTSLCLFNILMILTVDLSFITGHWVFEYVKQVFHKDYPIVFCLPLIFYTFIFFKGIKIYNVIDFSLVSIYKELWVWGIKIKINFFKREEILSVGNDCIPCVHNPAGRRIGTINGRLVEKNPRTDLYHRYSVSFLIDNGDVVNMYFGPFPEDHEDTKAFAALMSDYWKIPLVIGDETEHLKVVKSGNYLYRFQNEGIKDSTEANKNAFYDCLFVVLSIFAAAGILLFILYLAK